MKSKLEKLTQEGAAAFNSVADLPLSERLMVIRLLAFFNFGKDIPVSETRMPKDQLDDLHSRLVQCVIDFINETDAANIYSVSFYADSLNDSAMHGKWAPCTDSALTVYGAEDGMMKEIGFSA